MKPFLPFAAEGCAAGAFAQAVSVVTLSEPALLGIVEKPVIASEAKQSRASRLWLWIAASPRASQ
jgi:hypothetical protein